ATTAAKARDSGWTAQAFARLMPDRLAVVLLVDGQPVNLAPAEPTPRYVTWTAEVNPDPLPIGFMTEPAGATWMSDLDAARRAGMAVSIPLPVGMASIDTLLVIGTRTRASDLAGLLNAHSFTHGLEVLPEGVPSNNSSEVR